MPSTNRRLAGLGGLDLTARRMYSGCWVTRNRTSIPYTFSMATLVVTVLTAVLAGCATTKPLAEANPPSTQETSPALVADGQKTFRFETFGDEQVWTDTLRLHQVVEKNVDPTPRSWSGSKWTRMCCPPGSSKK